MSDASEEEEVEEIYVAPVQLSSGEEAPRSEWSSLELFVESENPKKLLYEQGLYSPGSPVLCNKYIAQSDSSVLRHVYYNYPAVLDPGIEEALLKPAPSVLYTDDGQQLYLDLCKEHNLCVVRLFHKNLLTTEINLSYYGVDPRFIRDMCAALQNNKTVTCFNLTDNFLNDDSCYHLGELLRANYTLQELILDGCRIGPSGLLNLGNNLNFNQTLKTLDLSRNILGDNGGVVFAKLVENRCKVKNVSLRKNELGRETCKALKESLEFNNPFVKLDLSWNNFTHVPSLNKMLQELGTSKKLEELNLSFNAFDGRVADAIKFLLKIPSLKIFNLSYNRLRGEQFDEMTGFLIYPKKLQIFDISFNPLTPEEAYNTLSRMLRPRVKIQTLLMEGICVEKPFLEMLERVKKMKSRKNFVVTFGDVLHNYTIEGPEVRDLLLNRAICCGTLNKKRKVDVALYFLELNKEVKILPIGMFKDRISADNVPLSESLLDELGITFPGPKAGKMRTVNLQAICEYINRLWPDKKLPPTPPPPPEPEPLPVPDKKGKGKGKSVTLRL